MGREEEKKKAQLAKQEAKATKDDFTGNKKAGKKGGKKGKKGKNWDDSEDEDKGIPGFVDPGPCVDDSDEDFGDIDIDEEEVFQEEPKLKQNQGKGKQGEKKGNN